MKTDRSHALFTRASEQSMRKTRAILRLRKERRDELDAAWQWVDPIHAAWSASSDGPKPYSSGTWGPTASRAPVHVTDDDSLETSRVTWPSGSRATKNHVR